MPAGVLALAIHTTVTHTTPFRPPGSRPAPGHCRLTSADSRPAMTGDRRRPRRPRQPRPCGRRRPPAGVSRLQPAPRPAPAAPVVLSHIIAACVPRQPRVRAHRPGRAACSRLAAPLPHPPARRRAAAHGVSDMPVTSRPGPEALPVRARSEGFRRPSWSGAPCPARARTERGSSRPIPWGGRRPCPCAHGARVKPSRYVNGTVALPVRARSEAPLPAFPGRSRLLPRTGSQRQRTFVTRTYFSPILLRLKLRRMGEKYVHVGKVRSRSRRAPGDLTPHPGHRGHARGPASAAVPAGRARRRPTAAPHVTTTRSARRADALSGRSRRAAGGGWAAARGGPGRAEPARPPKTADPDRILTEPADPRGWDPTARLLAGPAPA